VTSWLTAMPGSRFVGVVWSSNGSDPPAGRPHPRPSAGGGHGGGGRPAGPGAGGRSRWTSPSSGLTAGPLRGGSGAARGRRQMQAGGLVDVEHESAWDAPELGLDAIDRDGTRLFGLCFGVPVEPGVRGAKVHLDGVDPLNLGGDRDHGDHAPTESGGGLLAPSLETITAGRRRSASPRLEHWEAFAAGVATVEGIGVGSTVDDLRRAYPEVRFGIEQQMPALSVPSAFESRVPGVTPVVVQRFIEQILGYSARRCSMNGVTGLAERPTGPLDACDGSPVLPWSPCKPPPAPRSSESSAPF
jgi:hypothetical protein